MTWTVISYSELAMPLLPYTTGYVVVLVENGQSERNIAHVDKKYLSKLSIGMKGTLREVEEFHGKINLFVPEVMSEETEEAVTKVALVTGSSRGIGRAIALELAASGMDLIINNSSSRDEGMAVQKEIETLGRQALYIQADVSDAMQVQTMLEKTLQHFGRIDVLVNNAGIILDKKLENMDLDQWNKVIAVNLTGTFNCTKAVIGAMQKQGGGKIVNISSVVGEIGNVGQSSYAASKGGILSFTKTVAKEYAGDRILVNAITPGFIKTKMLEAVPKGVLGKILSQVPMGRLGKPEEVAKLVRFLASDDANYITGQVIDINGGLYM